jgi:hypothetical protein
VTLQSDPDKNCWIHSTQFPLQESERNFEIRVANFRQLHFEAVFKTFPSETNGETVTILFQVMLCWTGLPHWILNIQNALTIILATSLFKITAIGSAIPELWKFKVCWLFPLHSSKMADKWFSWISLGIIVSGCPN